MAHNSWFLTHQTQECRVLNYYESNYIVSFKYESIINPIDWPVPLSLQGLQSSGGVIWVAYDGLLLQRARHDGRIHTHIQDNKFKMWTNECLASSYFIVFWHACTHCTLRYAPITLHYIFTVSRITLQYIYKCTALLSSHVVVDSPAQLTLAINMIQ